VKHFLWGSALTLLVFGLGWVCGYLGRKPRIQHLETVQVATAKVERVTQVAVEAEAKAVEARPAVAEAKQAVEVATETRIEAGITVEQLPLPVRVEFIAMRDLIVVYETQLSLETARADAWKDVVESQKELIEAMTTEHTAALKRSKCQGFLVGSGATATVIALILLL